MSNEDNTNPTVQVGDLVVATELRDYDEDRYMAKRWMPETHVGAVVGFGTDGDDESTVRPIASFVGEEGRPTSFVLTGWEMAGGFVEEEPADLTAAKKALVASVKAVARRKGWCGDQMDWLRYVGVTDAHLPDPTLSVTFRITVPAGTDTDAKARELVEQIGGTFYNAGLVG